MFCNYCGNSNPEVAKFCRKCGKPIATPAQPPAPATPAPVAQPLVQPAQTIRQPIPQTRIAAPVPPPNPTPVTVATPAPLSPPAGEAPPAPVALPTPPPISSEPPVAAPPTARPGSRTKLIAAAASIAALLIGGWILMRLRSERPRTLTLAGHGGSIGSVVFSPDGRTLASGSSDGTVKLWDATLGQPLRTLSSHGNTDWVAFSPDGRTLASSGGSFGHGLIVWDSASGNQIRVLAGDADFVGPATFSPDGRFMAATVNKREGNETGLRLWDAASGNELRRLPYYVGPRFSPDSKLMEAENRNDSVTLLDVESDHEVRTLDGNFLWLRDAIFSPDGHLLATANNSSTVTLWDVSSGKQLREINDTSTVRAIAFSPDSRQLATGGEDHIIKLWDVASVRKIRALSGHSDAVNCVAFSPDGRSLASGGSDSNVILWPLTPSQ